MVSLATAVPWDPAAGKGAESGALPTGATRPGAIDGSKPRSGAAADPSSAAACPRASVLRGAMVPRGGWAGRVLPDGTEIPAGSRSHRRLAGAARRRLQHDLSLHGQPHQRGDERRDVSQPIPDARRAVGHPDATTPDACTSDTTARIAQCRESHITIDAVSRQPGASYPCAQAVRIPAMAHRKRETGGYGSDCTPSKAALRAISVKNGTEITAETPMNRERSR
jgi:hypothetical protein